MTDTKVRHLLLLTDDDFHAEVLGTYMRRDSVEVERVATVEEAAQGIASGADGVLVDLAKRGVNADAIMTLSNRAQRWEIPMMFGGILFVMLTSVGFFAITEKVERWLRPM